jgi:hypothetical protein
MLFSPAVAMLDIVVSLARRLQQRGAPRPPGVEKQLGALQELAGGLVLLVPHQADMEFLVKAIPQIHALMAAAQRCETRGVKYAELAAGLPGPLPRGSLRMCLADLCLTYVMGWRGALETICAHGGSPRRTRQLKLMVALEEQLRLMSLAPRQTSPKVRQAAEQADRLFEELAEAVEAADFIQIFEEAERIAELPRRALQ